MMSILAKMSKIIQVQKSIGTSASKFKEPNFHMSEWVGRVLDKIPLEVILHYHTGKPLDFVDVAITP